MTRNYEINFSTSLSPLLSDMGVYMLFGSFTVGRFTESGVIFSPPVEYTCAELGISAY